MVLLEVAVPPARAYRVKSANRMTNSISVGFDQIVGRARRTLMTDLKSGLKEQAKALKKAASTWNLSYGQALELSVALFTPVSSWNAYSAAPTPWELPTSVQDYFRVICRAQRRLHDLQVSPHSDRGGRAVSVMWWLDEITGCTQSGEFLWKLMDDEGVSNMGMIVGGDGPRPAQPSDGFQVVSMRLESWLFSQSPREPGNYIWDRNKEIALKAGFSERDANLIRELQREAPNHSWDLPLWFEVGVLDPDQEGFLRELQNQIGWQDEFSEMYRTDGFSIEDEESF